MKCPNSSLKLFCVFIEYLFIKLTCCEIDFWFKCVIKMSGNPIFK
ncbi:unnamed protein product [Schistosoma mattheei]|uniref:Uncharacterized protein n=1 Tax=Schistosoma mattheei TaxID=31246 RepID=A0A3P8DEN1_9TREM|nr:unnamed protein product [Schistosoma mattheei]